MKYEIAVIPGDGIGPEIVKEACGVLDRVGEVFGHSFHYTEVLMGGASIDVHGVPLTDEALETAGDPERAGPFCEYPARVPLPRAFVRLPAEGIDHRGRL